MGYVGGNIYGKNTVRGMVWYGMVRVWVWYGMV